MLKKSCIVVGAGPAGSASAIKMAEAGWQVTLLDRRRQIDQKICGECLSPPSRELLVNLGVGHLNTPEYAHDLDAITLIGPYGSQCKLEFGDQRPFSITRPVLDQALLDRAYQVGVEVRMGESVAQVERMNGKFQLRTIRGEKLFAEFLIGADGRHSWIARELGLFTPPKSLSLSSSLKWLKHSAVMAYFSQPHPHSLKGVEMHVMKSRLNRPVGYVGLNPVSSEQVNVIVVLHPNDLKERLAEIRKTQQTVQDALIELLNEHVFGKFATPTLRDRMKGAQPLSQQTWSVASIAWKPDQLVESEQAGGHESGCALVGDSAGFVDPFTGEGLYHALASAVRLSEEVASAGVFQGLKNYSKWHKKAFDPEEKFCFWLQKLLPFSRLADYAIGQLGRKTKLKTVMAEAVGDRLPTTRVLSPWYWSRVLWPGGG